MTKRTRSLGVQVRFSPEEKKIITRSAQGAGVGISTWIRFVSLSIARCDAGVLPTRKIDRLIKEATRKGL